MKALNNLKLFFVATIPVFASGFVYLYYLFHVNRVMLMQDYDFSYTSLLIYEYLFFFIIGIMVVSVGLVAKTLPRNNMLLIILFVWTLLPIGALLCMINGIFREAFMFSYTYLEYRVFYVISGGYLITLLDYYRRIYVKKN